MWHAILLAVLFIGSCGAANDFDMYEVSYSWTTTSNEIPSSPRSSTKTNSTTTLSSPAEAHLNAFITLATDTTTHTTTTTAVFISTAKDDFEMESSTTATHPSSTTISIDINTTVEEIDNEAIIASISPKQTNSFAVTVQLPTEITKGVTVKEELVVGATPQSVPGDSTDQTSFSIASTVISMLAFVIALAVATAYIKDNRRRIIRFFRPRPAFRTGLNSFAMPERHITVTFTRNEIDCVDDHL